MQQIRIGDITIDAVIEHYSSGGKNHPNKDIRVQPFHFTESEKAALIAKTALATGGPIDLVAESLGIMTRAEMEALLVPENLTQPVRLSAAPVPPAAEPSGTKAA